MKANEWRTAGTGSIARIWIATALLLLGQQVLADEAMPRTAAKDPASYVDVATLPVAEGQYSTISFVPREGRYVMKVKRGWSGQLVVSGQYWGQDWSVTESTSVGGPSGDSEEAKTSRSFFLSHDPVLEVVVQGRVNRCRAVRQGAASLRYVGISREGKSTNCELRVEVEADTTELDTALLRAVPGSKIKITEARSAAVLTGTVPSPDDVALVKSIAEQFYPQILMQVKIAPSNSSGTDRRGTRDLSTRELRELRDEVRLLRDDIREMKALMDRRQVQSQPAEPQSDQPADLSGISSGILFITSTWAAPCQQLQPIIRRLQRNGYKIQTIDVDKESGLVRKLGVTSIPAVIVLQQGKIQEKIVGLTTEAAIKELGKKHRIESFANTNKPEVNSIEAQLITALDRQIEVAFVDTPLKQAIGKIQNLLDVNVVIDSMGLEEAGVQLSHPISLVLNGVSARSIFRLMLEPLNLAIVVDNEVIKITSLQRSKGELSVVSYPLEGVLQSVTWPGGGSERELLAMCQNLARIIVATIEPNSWEEVGGTASVRVHELTHSLVVRQTRDVHDEIAGLLDKIRLTKKLPAIPSSAATGDKYAVPVIKTYAVADLIVPVPDALEKSGSPGAASWFRLIELIKNEIDPDCWDEPNSVCSIRAHEQTLSLIVRARESTHERIMSLLERERQKLDLNVVFEIKIVDAADETRFERQEIAFNDDVAYPDASRVEAMLKDVAGKGGDVTACPRVTTMNGSLATLLASHAGGPIVPQVYVRGSAVPDRKSIRINAAIQSKSIVQNLINRTIKIPDGGYVLFDATDKVRRDNLGLGDGHRLYVLVHAKLQTTKEPNEER